MNLLSFPFDKETCVIKFESYAYPLSEVKYNWKSKTNGSITIPRRRLADVSLTKAQTFKKSRKKEVDGEKSSYLGLRMFFGNVNSIMVFE